VLAEEGKILSQMRTGEGLSHCPGREIKASVSGKGCSMLLRFRRRALLIKSCGGSYDLSLLIPDRAHPEMDGNSVTTLVAEKPLCFTVLSVMDGRHEGASRTAIDTVVLVTIGKNIRFANAAQNLITLISRDLFRALIPEQNRPIPADHVHAGFQILENRTKDARVVELQHGQTREDVLPTLPSAENTSTFRRFRLESQTIANSSFGQVLASRNEIPARRMSLAPFQPMRVSGVL
jgi:hypothetical protein